MKKCEIKYPAKTLKEAVDILYNCIAKEDQEYIGKLKKSDLIRNLHHGFGTWIRNNFGLWAGNELLKKDIVKFAGKKYLHPDSCSTVIIEEFWKKLNKEKV